MARSRPPGGNAYLAALGYAASLVRLGQSLISIAGHVIRRGFTTDPHIAQDIASSAAQGVDAGGKYRYLQAGYRLRDRNMPAIPGLPSAYVYQVAVQFISNVDGSVQYRTVVVQSNTNLTRQEIMDAGRDQAEAQQGTGPFNYGVWAEDNEIVSSSITLAMRRG